MVSSLGLLRVVGMASEPTALLASPFNHTTVLLSEG